MAEQDLLALVKRLEAVALKLESSAGAGGAGKSLLFYVRVMERSGQCTGTRGLLFLDRPSVRRPWPRPT